MGRWPSHSDMDVWRGTPAACGPRAPPKMLKKGSRSNILGTIQNIKSMNKLFITYEETCIPDKNSAVLALPDAPKGSQNLTQIKRRRYHINSNLKK